MALFLAIIVLPIAFLTLNGIVSNSRKRVFPVLLFLPILLFLFLANRLDGLIRAELRGRLAVGLLCFFGPGFLDAGFLDSSFLGLHL